MSVPISSIGFVSIAVSKNLFTVSFLSLLLLPDPEVVLLGACDGEDLGVRRFRHAITQYPIRPMKMEKNQCTGVVFISGPVCVTY